jgi:hypothetical protein
MHAWTILIAKPLKTSYVMQSKTSKNNMEAPVERIELQDQFLPDAAAVSSKNPHREVLSVADIAKGLRESLKNVHNYRLSMHDEIKDILKRQGTYRKRSMQKALSAAGSKRIG